MKEFSNVIGYESIKKELIQICDMMHNMDIYEKLGAKMSKGFLLYGEPGVGKSLMARCFLKACGRKSYTIRRDKHNGDFIDKIRETFEEAKKNAPSVVLLDDMDKFVVEDKSREEYVVIQSCIDGIEDCDVYVIATANELMGIPDSLLRSGRFDRRIRVHNPSGKDAEDIIKFYLKSKAIDSQVNINYVAKMLADKSCAELETIINESAISAGFERSPAITMKHIVDTVLRDEYGVNNDYQSISARIIEQIAYHEAGHIVMSELLDEGKIGIASLGGAKSSDKGGFVSRFVEFKNNPSKILMCLAGKCAVELKLGKTDNGATTDLGKAKQIIKFEVIESGKCGVNLIDVFRIYENPSDTLRSKQETAVHIELEKYIMKARDILIKNDGFLQAVKNELIKKKTLLNSDVKKLREQCKITEVI